MIPIFNHNIIRHLSMLFDNPILETQNIHWHIQYSTIKYKYLSCEHILNEDSILIMCWIGNCICKYNLSAHDCPRWIYFWRSFWSYLEAYTSDTLRYVLASYIYAWSTFNNTFLIHRFYANHFPVFPVLVCIAHDIISHHLGVSLSTKHLLSSSKHALLDVWSSLSAESASGKWQIFLIGT